AEQRSPSTTEDAEDAEENSRRIAGLTLRVLRVLRGRPIDMPGDTLSKPSLLTLRLSPPPVTGRLVGAAAIGVVILLWWLATSGLGSEDRFISPVILPSPAEVVKSFPTLLNERGLIQSIAATLKRVLIGFGLAAAVGAPLGIMAGSWRVVEAPGA